MLSILLVEDQDDGRNVLAEFLRFAGFQVTTAEDGHRALELAARQRPDLVLMDLAMPGLDGWEATRRLKTQPATRTIPIWALTAFSDRKARDRAFAAHRQDRRAVKRLHRFAGAIRPS